jgi:hypothetical protein
MVSDMKSTVNLFCSLVQDHISFFVLFKVFFLVFSFQTFTMMCLAVDFFDFILFGVQAFELILNLSV